MENMQVICACVFLDGGVYVSVIFPSALNSYRASKADRNIPYTHIPYDLLNFWMSKNRLYIFPFISIVSIFFGGDFGASATLLQRFFWQLIQFIEAFYCVHSYEYPEKSKIWPFFIEMIRYRRVKFIFANKSIEIPQHNSIQTSLKIDH